MMVAPDKIEPMRLIKNELKRHMEGNNSLTQPGCLVSGKHVHSTFMYYLCLVFILMFYRIGN